MSDVDHMTVKLTHVVSVAGVSVAAILGGFWALLLHSESNLNEKIAKLDTTQTTMQASSAVAGKDADKTEMDLRSQLIQLTTQLKVTTDKLSELTTSVSSLNDSIRSIDTKVTEAGVRQRDFERWVIVRLGPAGFAQPTMYPPEWIKSQDEVFKTVATGTDPLSGWYQTMKVLPQKQ